MSSHNVPRSSERDDGIKLDGRMTFNRRSAFKLGAAVTAGTVFSPAMKVAAQSSGSLSPPAGSIVFDGITNSPLGNANLFLNEDGFLVVDNIGATGLDGVRQAPLPSNSTLMITGLGAPNFGSAGLGAQARVIMFGVVDNTPGGIISVVTIDVVDDEGDGELRMVMNGDMSSIGVTKYWVRIFLGGELVAEAVDLPSGITTLPLSDKTAIDCGPGPDGTTVYTYEEDPPVAVTIPGVGEFLGDRVCTIGQDATSVWTIQTQLDNFFKNTGAIVMTSQFAGPAPVVP